MAPTVPAGAAPAQRTGRQRRPPGAPPPLPHPFRVTTSAALAPVVVLTSFLSGAVYGLLVPGRPRAYAKAAVAVVLTVFCLARLYLAVDHLDDVLFAVALGVAVPVTAFRYFTPNEVFPV